MPLNQALVGKAYPAVRYEVGREKLREFAIAVGETDPIYHDEAAARAAGHPDIPAVPTFAVVLSLRAGQVVYGDPELGLDYSRVVHGEQEFVYHRQPKVGDVLEGTARISDVYEKDSSSALMEFYVMETSWKDASSGAPVCDARFTLIVRDTGIKKDA